MEPTATLTPPNGTARFKERRLLVLLIALCGLLIGGGLAMPSLIGESTGKTPATITLGNVAEAGRPCCPASSGRGSTSSVTPRKTRR
jgi:hypothetical protein